MIPLNGVKASKRFVNVSYGLTVQLCLVFPAMKVTYLMGHCRAHTQCSVGIDHVCSRKDVWPEDNLAYDLPVLLVYPAPGCLAGCVPKRHFSIKSNEDCGNSPDVVLIERRSPAAGKKRSLGGIADLPPRQESEVSRLLFHCQKLPQNSAGLAASGPRIQDGRLPALKPRSHNAHRDPKRVGLVEQIATP